MSKYKFVISKCEKKVIHIIFLLVSLFQKKFPVDTKIIDYEASSEKNYTACLRLKSTSKEDFKTWLAEFEKISSNTYRLAKTVPSVGKTVVYKVSYFFLNLN